jgi:hypothetical protein
MATNDPTPNPQISDIVKLVNLEDETVLIAKLTVPPGTIPPGTTVKEISITLDPPLPGGGWCVINTGTA